MVRRYHLLNVVHLSPDRPFASPAQCSQIFTDPPGGVCNHPFHRCPFTQTLLEDFHPWQESQPHHEYDHLAGRIICENKVSIDAVESRTVVVSGSRRLDESAN
jgi:hypothetical protein